LQYFGNDSKLPEALRKLYSWNALVVAEVVSAYQSDADFRNLDNQKKENEDFTKWLLTRVDPGKRCEAIEALKELKLQMVGLEFFIDV
jgi:hypothetical protein